MWVMILGISTLAPLAFFRAERLELSGRAQINTLVLSGRTLQSSHNIKPPPLHTLSSDHPHSSAVLSKHDSRLHLSGRPLWHCPHGQDDHVLKYSCNNIWPGLNWCQKWPNFPMTVCYKHVIQKTMWSVWNMSWDFHLSVGWHSTLAENNLYSVDKRRICPIICKQAELIQNNNVLFECLS